MPLKKSQLKELTTIYIPSPLEQIQDNQFKMCDKLKEIKDKQEKVSKWKHKHEEDFPQMILFLERDLPNIRNFFEKDLPAMLGLLQNTLYEISELKTLIQGRRWTKSK
jgi:hypothetical protein